ncbi:hypothetical protein E0L93_06530 [Rubrobacter taiwanensis]|uniref:Alkaline phosphatase family protein n=1 Tax=Rubrobacter taiwanensis TaxID=185139 RepID=A0A4R1BKZ4_9ACTN|nr:hypothetical protein [Rubrobacter taiwanensis]TCJ18070.1 hypothetical protein E0L93_06530 [Rubrobacter taiwanensis]
MRKIAPVLLLFCLLLLAGAAHPAAAAPPERPAVLVLVEELSWEAVRENPELAAVFEEGAVANLSTVQGEKPQDPRLPYLFLGAGARADTSVAPRELPGATARIGEAFTGPASTVHPGALGDALARSGVKAAAVGDRALLVAMDSAGNVPLRYPEGPPGAILGEALEAGAGFIALEAAGPEEAAEAVEAARAAGAAVAVASPLAPEGAANLTPFTLLQPDGEPGALYSPGTRTAGLISSADVAPTLLAALGAPAPPEMTGRAATIEPGGPEPVERMQERLAFVAEQRFAVWALIAAASIPLLAGSALRWGRDGVAYSILAGTALPAGALLAAAFPVTGAAPAAALTLGFAAGLAALALRLSGSWSGHLALVFLISTLAIAADSAAGGALMRYSTLGFNPAYGARFYGIGNEYAAVLLGALCVGLGALCARRPQLFWSLAVAGSLAVPVLGLPVTGANVGASLAAGAGIGATLGLMRRNGPAGAVLWSAGGLGLAAAASLLSALLDPEASHGTRALSGRLDLAAVAAQRLLLSLQHLLNPALLAVFAAFAGIACAGWLRVRGTAFGAGMLGGAVAALAMGALNDSGLVATVLTLAYPAAAAAVVLLTPKGGQPRILR